jgi:hypothetical protein
MLIFLSSFLNLFQLLCLLSLDIATIKELKDLWLAMAGIATTLAGFTLATYSIYVTRSEMASSNSFCRNYSFVEDNFLYSLQFMFLILMLFTLTALLSLYFVVLGNVKQGAAIPSIGQSIWFILVLFMSILGWAVWSCVKLWKYIWRIKSSTIKTRGFSIEREESILESIKEESILESSEIERFEARIEQDKNKLSKTKIYYSVLAVFYIIIVIASVIALFLGMTVFFLLLNSESIWINRVKVIISSYIYIQDWAIYLSIFSFIIGTLSMYIQYYLFQPRRLLFKVDFSTSLNLKKGISDIDGKCDSAEKKRKWLECRIENRIAILDEKKHSNGKRQDELNNAKELLTEARKSIIQTYTDPRTGRKMDIIKRREYHKKWFEFFIDNPFQTYEEIITVMNFQNLYLEGLNRYDARLKELPEQIELLLNEIPIVSKKVKNSQSSALNSKAKTKEMPITKSGK